MKIEEKNWSKTLLSTYGHIETICDAIDKTILSYGIGSGTGGGDTEYVASKMISLMDRKKFLINIKVLVDSCLYSMDNDYSKVLVLKFVDKIDSKMASEAMKISSRTYFRKINLALEMFWSKMSELGYSVLSLQKIFCNESWIMEIFKSYNKKKAEEIDLEDYHLISLALKSYKRAKVASGL